MKEENLKIFKLNKSILKDFDTLMTMRLDFVEELVVNEIDSNSKLLNIIGLCINIKTLIIEGDQRINTDSIISNICKPEQLEILVLNNVRLPNHNCVKKLTNLKMILFNNIRYNNMGKFLNEIPNPQNVQGISFCDVDFGKNSIEILKKYCNLRYLNLANIINGTWDNLEFISKNRNLKKLNIKNNKIELAEVKNLLNGNYKKNIFVEVDTGNIDFKTRNTLKITEEGATTLTAYTTDLKQITEKINLSKVDNLNLVLNGINDVCKYEKKLRRVRENANIIIKDISFLSVVDAEKLKDNIMIQNIYLKDINESYMKNSYTVDSYIKMRAEIDKIINQIPKCCDEPEKFFKIYKLLGKTFEIDDLLKTATTDITKIENALIEKKCTSIMYAKILGYCLSCLDIESEIIAGYLNKNEKAHMWNQVNICGKWYNVDIALDSKNITQQVIFKTKLKYCLASDKIFNKTHTPQSKNKKYIAESYDIKIIESSLNKSNIVQNIIYNVKKIFKINKYKALPSGNEENE